MEFSETTFNANLIFSLVLFIGVPMILYGFYFHKLWTQRKKPGSLIHTIPYPTSAKLKDFLAGIPLVILTFYCVVLLGWSTYVSAAIGFLILVLQFLPLALYVFLVLYKYRGKEAAMIGSVIVIAPLGVHLISILERLLS